MSRPQVVLVGPMGAGKTTVGGLLAARWGTTLRDTDADVEVVAGKSVADVFVEDGEAHFRTLERQAVVRALTGHDGVLALGGGAVLDDTVRGLLADHVVVALRVGLTDAVARVGLGTSRPLLLGNVRSRVKALLDERAALYAEVARATVDTDGRTPEQVADDVAALVDGDDAVCS